MSEKFAKRWGEGINDTPVTSKIKETVRPPGPLRPRIDFAIKRLKVQIQRLDKATDCFSERDKSIFARVVDAYSKHDLARACVFTCELAEIQMMEKMIIQARLALEQIVLRLSTCSELGDAVTMLAPAIDVLRSVKNGMSAFFPEAEKELGNIGNLISEILMDADRSTGLNIDFQTSSEDAQKILNEAASVAKQKVKEKFAELLTDIPKSGEKNPPMRARGL